MRLRWIAAATFAVALTASCSGAPARPPASPVDRLPAPAGASTTARSTAASVSPSASPTGAATSPPRRVTGDRGFTDLGTVVDGPITAFGGTLYGFEVVAGTAPAVRIVALDTAGHRRTALFRNGEIANYYDGIAAGTAGVYAGTRVIRRFTTIPDELVRIDPASLKVVARRALPQGGARPVVAGGKVYVVSDTRIQRIDPVSLATVASYTHSDSSSYPVGDDSFWSVAVAGDVVYAAYGDGGRSTVMRLDAATLRPLPGSWTVPPRQGQSLVATSTAVWMLSDSAARRLRPTGGLGPAVVLPATTWAGVPSGSGLVVTNEGPVPLIFVDADGHTTPLPYPGHDCTAATTDGEYIWARCGDDGDIVRFVTGDTVS